MDREDLYDFFRLHTYRALARTYLREFNPELEADALQILSDLATEKKATVRNVEAVNAYALAEMSLGKSERALGAFMEVYSLMRSASFDDTEIGHLTEYNIACSYAHLGDASQAVTWLRKSLVGDTGELWGQMQADRDLDGIRSSPEFKEFIANKGPK